VALFADDSKVFKMIKGVEDCLLLQNDITRMHEWSVTWDLCFHPSKCQIITVTRGKAPTQFSYSMNGTDLELVSCIKDLGVDITRSLTWDTHIHKVIAKANSKMGMIRRTVGYSAPTKVTLPLFNTLVRSNLEYCSVLWSGTSRQNISRLERVQRHATKFILNYPELDYTQRLETLSLLPLSYRREILDLLFLFHCIHKQYDFDLNKFVQFNTHGRYGTRSASDHLKLKVQHCFTESHKMSYFNRIVPIWNQLPSKVRQLEDLAQFRLELHKFYQGKLHSLDVSNVCTFISFCHCTTCRLTMVH
jgi:hypothetical protein